MSGTDGLGRRDLLRAAASGTALTVACGRSESPFRFLSRAEARTLTAVCDQIIPPDEHPGASQVGAVDYIDRQLNAFHKRFRIQYRQGLRQLDEIARKRHGQAFSALSAADATELLQAIEARRVGTADDRNFFAVCIRHTMEGFYGNPRHGGNRDHASWRMLGIPVMPLRGRQVPS